MLPCVSVASWQCPSPCSLFALTYQLHSWAIMVRAYYVFLLTSQLLKSEACRAISSRRTSPWFSTENSNWLVQFCLKTEFWWESFIWTKTNNTVDLLSQFSGWFKRNSFFHHMFQIKKHEFDQITIISSKLKLCLYIFTFVCCVCPAGIQERGWRWVPCKLVHLSVAGFPGQPWRLHPAALWGLPASR